MHEVLERFLDYDLPDAVESIVLGADDFDGQSADGALARYASRLFGEQGVVQLRDIAVAHNVRVSVLSATDLFWMQIPSTEIERDDYLYLLGIEGIMNRLLLIDEVVNNDKRSSWSEADIASIDETLLADVASIAPVLAKGSRENPLGDFYGTTAERGGEWDLRTRFSLAVETLRLPYRLTYHFDCDAQAGVFDIAMNTPEPSWFPRTRYSAQSQTWEDASDERDERASNYAYAVSALVSAAAVGAGVGVKRIQVSGKRGTLAGDEVFSFALDRLPFLTNVVSRIKKKLGNAVDDMKRTLREPDCDLAARLAARHRRLESDERALPDDLAQLLGVRLVKDLDVLSSIPDDPWPAVSAGEADRDEAPMAAIAQLEEVVAQADDAAALSPGAPLYCSDTVARCLVALIPEKPDAYVRYSDAAFTARSILCDLLLKAGDAERACGQAEKLVELGPTSSTGYIDLANVLMERHEFEAAVDVLSRGLGITVQGFAISYLYYRLAFALWQTGRFEEAMACYVMSSYYEFHRPELISNEMSELMRDADIAEPPTLSQAHDILAEAGDIMFPCNDAVLELVGKLSVRFADEGFFELSGLVCTASVHTGYRDVLYAVSHSLIG